MAKTASNPAQQELFTSAFYRQPGTEQQFMAAAPATIRRAIAAAATRESDHKLMYELYMSTKNENPDVAAAAHAALEAFAPLC